MYKAPLFPLLLFQLHSELSQYSAMRKIYLQDREEILPPILKMTYNPEEGDEKGRWYWVNDGKRYLIPDKATGWSHGLLEADIQWTSAEAIRYIPFGGQLEYWNGYLFRLINEVSKNETHLPQIGGDNMIEKFKALLGSIRFYIVTFGWASDFIAKVASDGFSLELLFTELAYYFGTVGAIGTVDAVIKKAKAKKQRK